MSPLRKGRALDATGFPDRGTRACQDDAARPAEVRDRHREVPRRASPGTDDAPAPPGGHGLGTCRTAEQLRTATAGRSRALSTTGAIALRVGDDLPGPEDTDALPAEDGTW